MGEKGSNFRAGAEDKVEVTEQGKERMLGWKDACVKDYCAACSTGMRGTKVR